MADPAATKTAAERDAMREFWVEHSKAATVEEMMLDSKAAKIDQFERPEVLTFLGDVAGQRVVELGAGIGRFTRPLAQAAASVVAIDFMQTLIDQNAKANADCANVDFRCGDATELDLPAGETDCLFSNWLLMYLSDAEVAALAAKALAWVADGGTVFFRESCFRQSGDTPRASNPTHYRDPRSYFDMFDGARAVVAGGRHARWELVGCRCVEAYVKLKANQNQLCWKWRKVVADEPHPSSMRHFLDNQQYNTAGILRYEKVFGAGFVSTGGAATTAAFVDALALRPGDAVLDVGCGIGGGAFYMAARHGARVHGVDLSVNMVLLAMARAADARADAVSFEIADVATVPLPAAAYDVVYSRDTILHVADKKALLERLCAALKPGGRLLVTDYCSSGDPPSPEFGAYIAQRGYHLLSVPDYGAALCAAGFADVEADDRTWQFKAALDAELARAREGKAAFVAEFSEADYDAVVGGWEDKLRRVAAGEQRWGLFTARRPAEVGHVGAATGAANGANGH